MINKSTQKWQFNKFKWQLLVSANRILHHENYGRNYYSVNQILRLSTHPFSLWVWLRDMENEQGIPSIMTLAFLDVKLSKTDYLRLWRVDGVCKIHLFSLSENPWSWVEWHILFSRVLSAIHMFDETTKENRTQNRALATLALR